MNDGYEVPDRGVDWLAAVARHDHSDESEGDR